MGGRSTVPENPAAAIAVSDQKSGVAAERRQQHTYEQARLMTDQLILYTQYLREASRYWFAGYAESDYKELRGLSGGYRSAVVLDYQASRLHIAAWRMANFPSILSEIRAKADELHYTIDPNENGDLVIRAFALADGLYWPNNAYKINDGTFTDEYAGERRARIEKIARTEEADRITRVDNRLALLIPAWFTNPADQSKWLFAPPVQRGEDTDSSRLSFSTECAVEGSREKIEAILRRIVPPGCDEPVIHVAYGQATITITRL